MCDRTGPEDGTDHSRMVGELLFLYCQPIEAGANQPLHARRNGDVAHLLALPAHEFERWQGEEIDRKSTRLTSSHRTTSYAVLRLKKNTCPARPTPPAQ